MSSRRQPIWIDNKRKADFTLSTDNEVEGIIILDTTLTPSQIGSLQRDLLPLYHHTVIDPLVKITHEF